MNEKLKAFLEENNLEITLTMSVTKPALYAAIDNDIKNILLSCIKVEYNAKEKQKNDNKETTPA